MILMKRVFFCFFCLLFLFGCYLSVPAFSDNGDTTVYVTRTGYAYHRDGCYHLKSRIPMSLREAVKSGYSPCKDCNPPRPDFTDSVATAPPRSSYDNGISRSSSGSGSRSSFPFEAVFWLVLAVGPIAGYMVVSFFKSLFLRIIRLFRRSRR